MTRTEAAKICQSIKFILENSDYTEAVEEALDMAIAALDQEETLKNLKKPNKSDLISRQAAIDAVGKAMPQLTTPDGCGEFDHEIQIADEAFSDCMKIINDLPSAQPFTAEQIQTMQELESAQVEKAYELGKADRPTGRWHIEPGIGCFCSKCSFDIGNDLDFMEYVHYCPKCGADMRGGDTK
jgi:hypothetical protein